jgi:hypothetical protein
MASVLDVIRATRDAPAADTEIVGPPEPPKKRSVADVVRAAREPPSEPAPPPPTPGAAAGGMIGGVARREEERAAIPELLRRPEEPEPEPPPLLRRPPEEETVPPLLRRPAYEEAPPGAYGVPTRLEKAALYGTRIGVPIVASTAAGFLSGPGAPVMAPLAGASAATATELELQKYEKSRGFRKEVSPGGVVLQGALGGFQGLPFPATLSAPARFAARTAEGTAFGTAATTAGTLIEEKRLPTKEELAQGALTGAVFGAAGGAFEAKGVPYLHERSAEFVGPREGGLQSRRQARAALATSADQLAGETTMPPVGEPEPRMVTRPGETIGGEPGEFVGPPKPEPLPIGTDVQFRHPGEDARTTPGRVVDHVVEPESGRVLHAVETADGAVVHRSIDDVEPVPGAAPELVGPPEPPPFVGPPEPPVPPGGEPPPPPGGEPPGAGMRPETAFEPPPEERGPYGQRPTFRRYPGLGEALTGEEIGPQLGADPQRMTRAIESVDREFGDVFDEPTRDRLKQQIRDNQARFEYLGRGKQTVERTQGLGRDLLFDLDAAKLEPAGTTWSPEKTAAAKNHIAALDQGIVAAQEAFDKSPTPQNGLILQKAAQDQIDAFNIYRARGAEAGRTVNLYKASAEDLASGNQRLMLAALKRGVPPDKLAEIIRSTRPEQAKARAEMLMAVTERGPWHRQLKSMLQTIYISDILSGPPPHQRNIFGNSINALLLQPVAKGFGALHERLMRVPAAERTVRAGEMGKHYVGLYDGVPDAVYKSFEILKHGYTQEQAISYNLPVHELGVGRHPLLRAGLNIIPRGLGSADMFARVVGQEASLNGQAYTKARNQALVEQAGRRLPEGVTFAERLDQLYDYHRQNPTPETMAQAADEATRGVFQEQDKVARTVQFIRDKIPGGWMLAPFVTTSTNLSKLALHWMPTGYVMPSTRGKVPGITRRTQVIHLGEAHAGTAGLLLAPAVLWAMGGKLHGPGPEDPDEFAIWRQTHVPNSLELPNGLEISFQQIPALNVPLSAVGAGWDRGEAIRKQKGFVSPEDALDIFADVIAGAGKSVLDQPYMQGISNFMQVMRHPSQVLDVLRHPTEPKYWPDVNRLTKDIATGFVPGAGMLRWIEQIGDPTIREGKTIPQKIEAMIPGLSENVPPKLDEFGQPITIKKAGGAWGRALNPIETEYVKRDPLREELEKFGMTLSPPSAGTPEKGEPPYTEREGLVIREAKGQQVRAELEDLIASDAYQEADPEDQLTMLKSVLGQTRGEIGKAARALREEGLDVESLRW